MPFTYHPHLVTGALCAATLLPVAPLSHAQPTARTVALTGDAAPGATDGSTFTVFSDWVANHTGGFAFTADLDTPSATGFRGLWSGPTDTPTLRLHRGDAVADLPFAAT